MSPTPDMTAILEELSSGRIDAAEAARRIDALKGADATPVPADLPPEPSPAEPTDEELAAQLSQPGTFTAGAPDSSTEQDAWAAATDRPQQATFTTESFGRVDPVEPTPATDSSTPGSEPVRG